MKAPLAHCSLLIAAGALMDPAAYAQGTLQLSTLDAPTAGSLEIASNAWVAAWFQTGPSSGGYRLDSIGLRPGSPVGNPLGFSVDLWDFRTGQSQAMLTGPNPSTSGLWLFNGTELHLSPSTVYWFVVSSQNPAAAGSYFWNYTGAQASGNNGWQTGGSETSVNGVTWIRPGPGTPQFAVYATPIPEPAAAALMVSGFSLLGAAWCCGKRQTRRPERAQVPCQ